ncbi:MAG: DUF4411 family protein [Leptonema sp. (in: bacteria)]
METLKYVIDSNIFIEASRRYYSFDFGTKFWDFLEKKAKEGIVCSIDKVLKEIQKGDKKDPLRQWAEKNFIKFFNSTENEDVLQPYKEIVNYVNNQKNQYTENAIDEFLQEDNADAWIISYAKYKNLIVVTHEKYNPDVKKKVLIPNICEEFKIEYIDTFGMLRDLKFKL